MYVITLVILGHWYTVNLTLFPRFLGERATLGQRFTVGFIFNWSLHVGTRAFSGRHETLELWDTRGDTIDFWVHNWRVGRCLICLRFILGRGEGLGASALFSRTFTMSIYNPPKEKTMAAEDFIAIPCEPNTAYKSQEKPTFCNISVPVLTFLCVSMGAVKVVR